MLNSMDNSTAAAREHEIDRFDLLRQQVQERMTQFRKGPITPQTTYHLETDLKALLDDVGRELLQDTFEHIEPETKSEADPRVRYHKQTYRINKRTKATIDTIFGSITVWSFLYLAEDDGEPGLHPLHVRLGLDCHATTVLAERVALWAVDHSQKAVCRLLWTEHRIRWSHSRLRGVLRTFRRRVSTFRHEVQVERLLGWLKQASHSRGRHKPVLAVGRDGVMVPIRHGGYQEASTATVSVYDRRGRRLGTVYLGQMPEPRQQTLTAQLNRLLSAVLEGWQGPLPRLAYVTDKGKVQDNYWHLLRTMTHPRDGQRLYWDWVLDFFHVCGYVGQLREALFEPTNRAGYAWFRRMRHWLRDRCHGVAQVLRSAVQQFNHKALSTTATQRFWKAYRYLRRHSRLMDYPRYRRQGLPIGSGVTEAACKTVFSQRLKRSGMRWHKESGQVIVDLRVISLSGIWDDVIHRDLQTRDLIQPLQRKSYRPSTTKRPKETCVFVMPG